MIILGYEYVTAFRRLAIDNEHRHAAINNHRKATPPPKFRRQVHQRSSNSVHVQSVWLLSSRPPFLRRTIYNLSSLLPALAGRLINNQAVVAGALTITTHRPSLTYKQPCFLSIYIANSIPTCLASNC